MSFEMLNVIVTVIVILTTISTTITVFNYQVIFAPFDDDNDRSIMPNYQEGYEVGKVQGSKDDRSSNQHNDRCPPDDHELTNSFCCRY